MNAIALPTTVADIVAEYVEKEQTVEAIIADLDGAFDRLHMAATVQGTFVEPMASKPHLHASTLRKNLLKSGWRAVYNRLQIDHLASANDKKRFDQAMADPPPLTMDNAKATFGDYLIRPRFHVLRGLAEVFCSLDSAYKSHSKVRVGVKGLPKRVILTGWESFHSEYAQNKFRDIVNALAALRGQERFAYGEFSAIRRAYELGEDAVLDGRVYTEPPRYPHERVKEYATIDRGLTVRRFANGNAHIFFDKWALLDINRALAEFYGEVLPDVEPEHAPRQAGTSVSKDLQFYWSPEAVVHAALEFAGIHKREDYGRYEAPAHRVLEPSCGDGRILDELRARGCRSLGIEFDAGRAAQARAKSHSVMTANFLEHVPTEEFDYVVMNPPFYGRHYAKHVRHALRFLKPGGTLVSVLPASARYDHDEVTGEWRDLPVASFSEAGTNIPTTLLKMRKGRE